MKNSRKIKVGRRVRIVTYLPATAAGFLQSDCNKMGISLANGVERIIYQQLETCGDNCIPHQEAEWLSE